MQKVIAIDGFTATGKGTTASMLANRLGWMYYDSGGTRRALTLYAMRHRLLDASDEEKVAMIEQAQINFRDNGNGGVDTFLGDENVSLEIRTSELGMKMKSVVICLPLRKAVIGFHRALAAGNNLVTDGRDMGTEVFPDAFLKIFMTCDISVRAQRRYEQLSAKGLPADLEAITKEIEQRDWVDYLRPDAANTKADDAIVIDTTNLTIKEQVEKIHTLVAHSM